MDEALKILTFGGLSIRVGDRALAMLASRKAELLLVYLARQARPYAREVLAELLWEGRSQSQAQANLRVVLSSLRRNLGEYLEIDRQRAGMLPEAEIWLDANRLEAALRSLPKAPGTIPVEQLEAIKTAIELYQGEFLEGIFVQDAPALDAWMVQERQRLEASACQGLSLLVETCLRTGDYQDGIAYANRLVQIAPLEEAGQRQLMQLLALSGQRAAAINQYEHLKLSLQQELGVEPEAATRRLLRQIESGEPLARGAAVSQASTVRIHLPPYLQEDAAPGTARPVFVGRETELQALETALQGAMAGSGALRFVTGGAGSGKTALMEEFARRAASAHPDLLVALGGCNALGGVGDAYLPFRDMLGMLTGDVEGKLIAGKINREIAWRTWLALPVAMRALLDHGADLIDVFVTGSELHSRFAAAMPGQFAPLEGWLERIKKATTAGDLQPSALFEEYLQVLCAISKDHSLLILLDDLQWSDTASLNLLFHIGRRIATGRMLLIAAYREEEASLAEATSADLLKKALAEFKRQYGEIWIDLSEVSESQGRAFVDAFLDSEPNRLDEQFRQSLYTHTGGHALFTVELCRNLQERGMLLRDEQGYWKQQSGLDWGRLPARVEGVIEARLGRLDGDQRAVLEAGAVEGDEFTLQVAAQVCGKDERWMVRQLSQELCQAHRLLSEVGVKFVAARRLYRYRFRHSLYQEYLYQRLGEIDRSWIHGQVGSALEELYGEAANQVAAQLGWHYQQAGETGKAITYLEAAGDQAQQRYAYAEAINHYQAVVELLKESGEPEQASSTLLKLGMAYHANLEFEPSRQAYAEGFSLWHRIDASQSSTSLPPAPHPLRLTWLVPDQLNIISDDRISTTIIYNQLFCGLVSYHSEKGVIPDGAESWEIQDNGLRYIFHLREDATWSDGAPVTAHDYVLAWKRGLNPALQPVNASLFYDLKGAMAYHQGAGSSEIVGVKATDRFTLQVELEQSAGYFLHLLAYAPTFPVPEHVLQTLGEAWVQPGQIITNGAFRIEEWQPDERMILSRNPGYQGQYRGNIERVEVRDIPDIYEGIKVFEADHLDLLAYPYFAHQMELINDLKVRHTQEFFHLPDQGVTLIIFNSQVEPFDNLQVRQAFVQAIDKSTIIKTKYTTAMFIPAMGGLIPPSLAGHSPGIDLKYDRNRAQGLLAEAGYPGGKGFPKASIVTGDFPSRRLAVDILVEQWREVLDLEIEKVFSDIGKPFSDRMALKEGPSMAFVSIIPDYPDGDYYLRCFEEGYVRNTTGWRDETYDLLLQAARLEHNQPRRLKYYQRADQYIIEQAIVAPFYYSTTPYLVKPWVKQRFTDFKNQLWKNLIIELH